MENKRRSCSISYKAVNFLVYEICEMNYRVCSCEHEAFRDSGLLVESIDISTYYYLPQQIRIQLLKSQLELDMGHVNAKSCLL